jgi:cytochrome c553
LIYLGSVPHIALYCMLLCAPMRVFPALLLCLLSTAAWADLPGFSAPDWLFPRSPPAPATAPASDVKLVHIPNSDAAFTEAQLGNRFFVPDWHPADHGPMPDIVAHGHNPDVFACGYCHMPRGQGRPENAPLAGLPAQYIIQQVNDFKTGVRRSGAAPGYLPTEGMIRLAKSLTEEDLAAAADYFAAQRMTKRTRIIEAARAPKMHDVGWIYAPDTGGATEPLGERLLEMTQDPELHERRSDGPLYVAYVPVGSIARGKRLSKSSCATCHGAGLRGVGLIPPLAGRSPTYILRQLVSFKSGARAGSAGAPMKTVVDGMKINNMIDAAAYAGSLEP